MNLQKPLLLIRADGGDGIGMGHIMRSLTIADLLGPYFDIIYIGLENYIEGIEYVQNKGYRTIVTSEQNLLGIMLGSKAIGVITDNYAIDDLYVTTINKYFKLVVYLDDNANKNFVADLILNPNFGSEQLNYQVDKSCHLLRGSTYTLLKEEYRRSSPIDIKPQVRHVFFTVGGADPFNFTGKILEDVGVLKYKFHVVLGPSFPYENILTTSYMNNEHIIFHKEPNMYQLMQQCDMAISSCGSTLYEMGSLGIPIIGISVADNQIPLAKRMDEARCIIYLGDIREILTKPIGEALIELDEDYDRRKELHQRVRDTINKNGVEKVVRKIVQVARQKGIKV